jgi:hypothetical protein
MPLLVLWREVAVTGAACGTVQTLGDPWEDLSCSSARYCPQPRLSNPVARVSAERRFVHPETRTQRTLRAALRLLGRGSLPFLRVPKLPEKIFFAFCPVPTKVR